MDETKSRGHDRTRVWTAIIYPDSAPENWRDLLDEYHVEWAESPLHEFDTNPTGELKKAHWHIALAFDGPKSYEQVAAMLAPLNGPVPQKCHSLKGAVRYFAHLDNPEKHQYPVSEIVAHGGFDLAGALAPSISERYSFIDEMMDYCKSTGIVEFQELCEYARQNKRDTWFPLLCDSCALIMQYYLRSARYRAEAAARNRHELPALSDAKAGGLAPRAEPGDCPPTDN